MPTPPISHLFVRVSRHALERWRQRMDAPEATEADIVTMVKEGPEVQPMLAHTIMARRYVPSELDRFVGNPERTGVFVVRDNLDDSAIVVTFIRWNERQCQTAWGDLPSVPERGPLTRRESGLPDRLSVLDLVMRVDAQPVRDGTPGAKSRRELAEAASLIRQARVHAMSALRAQGLDPAQRVLAFWLASLADDSVSTELPADLIAGDPLP